MKLQMFRFLLPLMALSMLTFTACDESDDDIIIDDDVFEKITERDDLSMLEAALERVGLDNNLADENNDFTVFAPNNTAFNNYIAATPNVNSLDDISDNMLRALLLNHVIGEDLDAGDLLSAGTGYKTTLSTLTNSSDGLSMYIMVDGNDIRINDAADVVETDINSDNGTVHIVDAVIPRMNLAMAAMADGNFSILVDAVSVDSLDTDFLGTLTGTSPFTIFAPTNDAFVDLLDSNDDWDSLDDIPAATLDAVLRYHVVQGRVYADQLTAGMTINTLGGTLTVVDDNGSLALQDGAGNTVGFIANDVTTTNGVIHAIGMVLMPM